MANFLSQAIGSIFNDLTGQTSAFQNEAIFNRQEAEKQRLFNAEQSQLNRDFQERMVAEERAYNTPAAQMARARAAGLNPSLLYGQPISEAGSAPAGSEASGAAASASMSAGNPAQMLGLGRDFATLPAQIDLMRAQAEEIRSRIPLNQQKVSNLRVQIEDIVASAAQRRADVALKYSQASLSDAQKNNISFEQMYKQNLLNIDYQRLRNETGLNEASISKLQAETRSLLARANVSERELKEMVWTYAVRAQGLEKQNLLTDAQIREADETAAKLRKEGVRLDQITAIDSPQAIDAQGWANDMSGKNGVVNQIGATLVYKTLDFIKTIGGVLMK